MYRLIYLPIILALASCGTQRVQLESAKDSVSVIIKESVIYKDTTIYVEVPKESDKVMLPSSDTSHLETSIAISEAWLLDGKLNHTLVNKSSVSLSKDVELPNYITSKETDHKEVIVQKVEVEKELNKWQSFRMVLGDLTLIVIGVWLLLIIIKRVLLMR